MHSFKQRLLPLALVTSLLTSCATGSSDPACVCPPIKEYTPDFQKKLANEIAAMNEKDALVSILQDYALVRQQIVLCQQRS